MLGWRVYGRNQYLLWAGHIVKMQGLSLCDFFKGHIWSKVYWKKKKVPGLSTDPHLLSFACSIFQKKRTQKHQIYPLPPPYDITRESGSATFK